MQNHDKSIERRRFLKLSLTGAAASAILPSFGMAANKPSKSSQPIVYRTLGKTGVKLPVVSMGAMRGENKSLIEAGLKMGVVHFDTAYVYQNGKNEEMLGEVLANYKRKSFFIATKIVPDDKDKKTEELGPGSTAEKFLAKFNESLTRLKMDSVDLLYVHAISTRNGVLNPEMIKALQTAKKEKKTRFVGISCHKNEPEVLEAMIEAGIYDVALVSYNFKQDHRDQMKVAIQKAADAGIGIIAMKTMAGGFLDKEKTKPINTKAALKWVLQDENVCTTIPGFTSFAQLEESFGLMADLNLTEQEKQDLSLAMNDTGMYCNQCTVCVNQCVKGLPVNEIMRAYMYHYGYQQSLKAKNLLANNIATGNPCSDCTSCPVHCVKGFNVQAKIADVSRLVDVPNDLLT